MKTIDGRKKHRKKKSLEIFNTINDKHQTDGESYNK